MDIGQLCTVTTGVAAHLAASQRMGQLIHSGEVPVDCSDRHAGHQGVCKRPPRHPALRRQAKACEHTLANRAALPAHDMADHIAYAVIPCYFAHVLTVQALQRHSSHPVARVIVAVLQAHELHMQRLNEIIEMPQVELLPAIRTKECYHQAAAGLSACTNHVLVFPLHPQDPP